MHILVPNCIQEDVKVELVVRLCSKCNPDVVFELIFQRMPFPNEFTDKLIKNRAKKILKSSQSI